jgi:hypothetical protein
MSENEALDQFHEHVRDIFGTVYVCGMEMDAANVLRDCDGPAYREAFNNWVDAEDLEIV